MAIQRPDISILIPTRDRPEFVEHCLHYLKMQTFQNFEVIVCDNYLENDCKTQFEKYKTDKRFKYFTPPSPLSMCDNWDYALSKASGTYVSMISEKYLLRPNALSLLFQTLTKFPAELVSWWHEKYAVQEISENRIKGRYVPFWKPKQPSYFDPIDVLNTRFSFEHAPYSRTLGPMEVLGKIYSGCFHRDLIERIKKTYGRVFPPTSPDITSMVAGLSLAKSCLDIGQPLMMVCSSHQLSTGQQCYKDTSLIKKYFSQLNTDVQGDFASSLPLKDLWVGLSNYIARDYLCIQSLSPNPQFKSIVLNRVNLLIKIKRDLLAVTKWRNEAEREQMMSSWEKLVADCDASQQTFIHEQMLDTSAPKPSEQEIHFAGGIEVDTYPFELSAKRRAEMNWTENKVFRINDKFIYYENIKSVMTYFHDYYLHSALLLEIEPVSSTDETEFGTLQA